MASSRLNPGETQERRDATRRQNQCPGTHAQATTEWVDEATHKSMGICPECGATVGLMVSRYYAIKAHKPAPAQPATLAIGLAVDDDGQCTVTQVDHAAVDSFFGGLAADAARMMQASTQAMEPASDYDHAMRRLDALETGVALVMTDAETAQYQADASATDEAAEAFHLVAAKQELANRLARAMVVPR